MLAQVSWTEDVYCTVACDFVITVDFFVNVLMMSEKSVLVVSIAWWQLRRSKRYVANYTCGLQCKTLPLYSLSYCDLYVFLYSIASCGSVLIRVTKGLTLTVLWSPVILLMFQWWKHLFFIFCIIRHCRKKSHCSATTTNKAAALGVCLMWLLQPIPVARARCVAIETKFWPIMLKLPLIPWLATGSWQQEVKHHWLLYENGKIVF